MLKQKEQELNEQQGQIDTMQSALTEADNRNGALTEQVEALTADLTNLKDLLQQSQSNNETVALSLEQMRAELRASDERLEDRKSALAELMNEKQASAQARNDHQKASAELTRSIEAKLQDAGLTTATVDLQGDQTIAISVGSSSLFRPGSSVLTEEGSGLLATVGQSITGVERKIVVEGHSDNTPLGAKLEQRFTDNWGLSLARAVSTANFLTREAGIAPDALSVSGLGDTDPVADNSTVEGRQQNRRVEILLVDHQRSE